jgi:uncharacterized protein YbjT (DUF2867 family)
MTILVTGARGTVGSRVVAQLAASGHPVRASARDVSALRLPPGVETARLDLADPVQAPKALRGVTAMFLFPQPEGAADLLKMAGAAGVRRVVLLSTSAMAEPDADRNPIALYHQPVEQAVASSGLPYAVLRPGWLATNVLRDWIEQIRAARVRLAYPEAQVTPIHEDDIAEVAASLLTRGGHHGDVLDLTGPRSMTMREIVDTIGEELGRFVAVEQLTRSQALAERPPGMPEEVMAILIDREATAAGVPAPVNDSVERLLGKPARDFRHWVAEHRGDFL